MDPRRFDQLRQALVVSRSRRQVMKDSQEETAHENLEIDIHTEEMKNVQKLPEAKEYVCVE
jgi:hypothetical protein